MSHNSKGTYARMGLSESQAAANAEMIAARGRSYSVASDTSFRIQWDFHRREPADLREAVRMARKAYADEIPTKLHEGPDAIGEGGTPKMTAKAEGYIMGSAAGSDAPRPKCNCPAKGIDDPRAVHFDDCPANPTNQPLVSYYHAPFRAHLEMLSKGDRSERRRAAIVMHITIGQQGPVEAAIAEGAHPLDAKLVAWDALCSFLRGLTDMKLHLPRLQEGSEAVA